MSEEKTPRMPDDVRLRSLMVAYQNGDLDAVEQLHGLLGPALTRWLRARTNSAAEAEDLAQDAFLQIHRARHTYDPAYPVAPWAYAITRHVWLMHRRAQSRRPQATETIDGIEPAVRGEAETYVERATMRAALAHLDEGRRKPVVWHHVFGWSFKAIAARLGIRESAAKLRSSRGVAALRDQLRKTTDHDHDE